MSMLQRYKKSGGFLQLLNLLETCGAAKQEKFLKIIEEEDPRWAEALKTKMISIKRIFTWDDNTIAELTSRLNDLTLATALAGLEGPAKEKVYKMMGHSRHKKLDDIMAEKKPTPAEISTVFQQILTEVRQQIEQGYIYIEKIDPTLVVDSDIEEKLSASTLFSMEKEKVEGGSSTDSKGAAAPATSAGHASHAGHGGGHEAEALKRRLHQMMQENNHLKEKLVQAEHKIAQIRKLAG